MLREQSLSLFFDDVFVLRANCIPKFRFSLMNKVDPGKIKIFSMPTKESLPTANVAVGSVNSLDLVAKGIR